MSVNNWIQFVCCFNLATLFFSIVLHTHRRTENPIRQQT